MRMRVEDDDDHDENDGDGDDDDDAAAGGGGGGGDNGDEDHSGANTKPCVRRQSSRSPLTRRFYTSMFPSPNGTDSRKRTFHRGPAKATWYSDITHVIWPQDVPQTS